MVCLGNMCIDTLHKGDNDDDDDDDNNNNNDNDNNNYNVPVAAKRRLQKQHKITKYKPNITQQLHCKCTRDMTENVLSYILTYASKEGQN